MSRQTILKIGIVTALALVIGLIVYAFIPRASVLMSIAPENFTVTINGNDRKIKTGESITVTPGEFLISISSDNFETYTKKITIENGEEQELLLALKPQNDTARELLETEKSQEIIQRIANINMKKFSNQLAKDYPILKVLPINDKFYTIISCPSKIYLNDVTKTAICVNLYNLQAKQSAIDTISNRGFSVDNYEVYFVDESYDPSAQAGD